MTTNAPVIERAEGVTRKMANSNITAKTIYHQDQREDILYVSPQDKPRYKLREYHGLLFRVEVPLSKVSSWVSDSLSRRSQAMVPGSPVRLSQARR